MDQRDDRRVVHIELGCAGAGASVPARCCAVCTEPLASVTVGSCGHGERSIEGDRFCSVSGADCPSVVVAKAADDGTRGGGGGPAVPALTQQPASEKGNVGEYWYHGDTAAYSPDEQQNEKARDACKQNLIEAFMLAVVMGLTIWLIVVMYPGP